MPGALMRRWWRGIYADHKDGSRRAESPRAFSGFAARRVAPTDAGRPVPPRRGSAGGV